MSGWGPDEQEMVGDTFTWTLSWDEKMPESQWGPSCDMWAQPRWHGGPCDKGTSNVTTEKVGVGDVWNLSSIL